MPGPTAELDLSEDTEYRVRLYRHAEPDAVVVFEGTTTFEIFDDVPNVRRLGKRWRIRAACMPGHDIITGQLPGYRPGDNSIEFGERHVLHLLDRYDPALPYGPDGPTLREALEMHLETFAAGEGITDIRFADER